VGGYVFVCLLESSSLRLAFSGVCVVVLMMEVVAEAAAVPILPFEDDRLPKKDMLDEDTVADTSIELVLPSPVLLMAVETRSKAPRNADSR